jgi:hypothetical protein
LLAARRPRNFCAAGEYDFISFGRNDLRNAIARGMNDGFRPQPEFARAAGVASTLDENSG